MKAIVHSLSVAILYYVGTHEDDQDTLDCVRGIEKSLKRTGHKVTSVRVTRQNWHRALRTPGDIVFNFVEDERWVLYEKIAFRLEKLHRAQFGHDMSGLKYAIQKSSIKRLMKKKHINTPLFKIIPTNAKRVHPGNLRFPVIIKPSHMHAGIGISQHSVVTNLKDFSAQIISITKKYPGEIIAEEYVDGREIHVTVIGNGSNPTVLPYCEVDFRGKFHTHWSVYTYDAKWLKKSWEYADAQVVAPAIIPAHINASIRRLSLEAYRTFRCRDIARFDIRVDRHGVPFIIDMNMNPSINYYDKQDATLASVYALGWTYDRFIETLLTITFARVHDRQFKDRRLRK